MKTIVEFDADHRLFIYVVEDNNVPRLGTPRISREQLANDCSIREPCHAILEGAPIKRIKTRKVADENL